MWNFLKFNFEARFLPQARRFSAGALQKISVFLGFLHAFLL